MDKREEDDDNVRVVQFGFTLIDIAAWLLFIGLSVAMGYLYGLVPALLLFACVAITAYSTIGIVSRSTQHRAMQVLHAMHKDASEVISKVKQQAKEEIERVEARYAPPK